MVLPFPRSFADEDGFSLSSTESYVEITLSAPGGTTGLIPGASRTVAITVCTHSWEVWTHSATGETQVRSENFQPCDGVALTASIQSGDGTVSLASSTTGTAGTATATYVSGTGASQVLVAVPALGAGATIDFSPPDPETWGYDHSEGLIHASLSADGPTDGVAQGHTRTIQVAVDYSTWDVQISSYGNTTTNSFSTSPATGATISWTVLEGDGMVSAETNQTDPAGNSWASFTMGTGPCIVRADVAYGTSHSTSATISFQPPSAPPEAEFEFSHSEQLYSVEEIAVSGTADGLSSGDQRTISGVLYLETWDVWTDGEGNTENRNLEKSAVAGAVNASLGYGDGGISPGTISTDTNGAFACTFTMGAAASKVLVYPAGNSPEHGGGEVVFSPVPEVWTHTGDGSSYSLEFDADSYDLVPGQQQVLTAQLRTEQWEVWTSNFGNTEERNRTSAPATGEALTFAVDSGAGQLSSGTRITGTDGRASVTFTMDSQSALAVVSITEGPDVVATDSVQLNLTAEEWTHHHDEATIAINLTADGSTTSLSPGTARTISAQVSYTNWQIWTSNWGGYDKRFDGTGAANGASVTFSVGQGDGAIASEATSTDVNGVATAGFTMGALESRIDLGISYAGTSADATLILSPRLWTKAADRSSLSVNLADDDATNTITATVTHQTWEEWTDGTVTETRNETSAPAIGATVAFTAGSGTLGTSSGLTATNGELATSYSVNEVTSINSSVSFAGLSASATITVSPDSGTAPPVQVPVQNPPTNSGLPIRTACGCPTSSACSTCSLCPPHILVTIGIMTISLVETQFKLDSGEWVSQSLVHQATVVSPIDSAAAPPTGYHWIGEPFTSIGWPATNYTQPSDPPEGASVTSLPLPPESNLIYASGWMESADGQLRFRQNLFSVSVFRWAEADASASGCTCGCQSGN